MTVLAKSVQVQAGGSLVATGASGTAGTVQSTTTTGDFRVDASSAAACPRPRRVGY